MVIRCAFIPNFWEGEHPKAFELILVPVKSRTNHGRNAEYYAWVQHHLREHPVSRVVGFNKMPGLDVYYAADVCYAEKVAQEKGFFYRLTSRYRHYAAFERCDLRAGKNTQLLMLTDKQIADFQKHYQTESGRFHILPPGIYPDENTVLESPMPWSLSPKEWSDGVAECTVTGGF